MGLKDEEEYHQVFTDEIKKRQLGQYPELTDYVTLHIGPDAWQILGGRFGIDPHKMTQIERTSNYITSTIMQKILTTFYDSGEKMTVEEFVDIMIEINVGGIIRKFVDDQLKKLQKKKTAAQLPPKIPETVRITHDEVMKEHGSGSSKKKPPNIPEAVGITHDEVMEEDGSGSSTEMTTQLPPEIPETVQDLYHEVVESNAYEMTSERNGHCLIINNVVFRSKCYGDRPGSDADVKSLEWLWENHLKYKVKVHHNLEAEKMKETLRKFANDKEKHGNVNAAVVIILSHGGPNGMIAGTDCVADADDNIVSGGVDIKDIISFYNNKNCPVLKGKPKMFFIQACRGGLRDPGVRTDGGEAPRSQSVGIDAVISTDPTVTDMMFIFATSPDHVSYRDTFRGSWFIQTIVKVYGEQAKYADIQSMNNVVARVINKHDTVATDKNSVTGVEKQSVHRELGGWTKKLYFNP